jgi:tetratricopeptide (TPR) repeat protein
MLRRGLLIGILILGALLISKKAVFWTVGSFALSAYRADARSAFTIDNADEATNRSDLLAMSVRFMPESDSAWREYARFAMHYADHENEGLKQSIIWQLTGKPENDDDISGATSRATLLDLAAKAFQQSVKANRLDSHAMFWGPVARLNWFKEIGNTASSDLINEAYAQMKNALELDPWQPGRYFTAGQLAFYDGRMDEALNFFQHAVDQRMEYFHDVAEMLYFSSAGLGALKTLAAGDWKLQRQLYLYLLGRWRFGEANDAWLKYRRLAGLPLARKESQLVSNGSFQNKIGEMFNGWMIQTVPGVSALVKREESLSFLDITMDDGPANYFHVHQDVSLKPGARYQLKAKVMGQGFREGTRIGIEAIHPMSPGLFSAGDYCVVTPHSLNQKEKDCRNHFAWLSVNFTVPETLPLLRIRLRRHAEEGEADSGKGTVRLTDVSLSLLEPDPPEEPQE